MHEKKVPNPYFKIESRYLTALVLLLITVAHMMIFSFFQIYGNFLNQAFIPVLLPLKFSFYAVVILTSIFHQIFVRNFTLKFTLMAGLFCNVIGLATIWASISMGGSLTLVFISMFFIGVALTSVLNSIITYLVIEFPGRVIIALIIMFAFCNFGNLASNILFNAFKAANFNNGFFFLSILLMVASILYIGLKFFDPEFPKHLAHLRKGTLLWKELHYRLGFFIISIIAYGIIESIFGVWSGVYLLKFLSQALTKGLVSIFWLSMMIGQLSLLTPLYFYSPKKIFPFLILALILTTFFYHEQTSLSGFVLSLILGGISCAAIFPILLSFMEEEVIELSRDAGQENYLPYIETGTCLMLGGYFVGVAIVDIWVLKYIEKPTFPMHNVFHWAAIVIACLGLLSTYLTWSSSTQEE